MGEKSEIEWTDATWNPWHGCVKVSPGCKFCYMYRDKDRWKQDPTKVIRSRSNFYDPLKWTGRRLIFSCSWSDFFIEQADEWRSEAWDIIKRTPQHTYQILTKRPERVLECLPDDWGDGYPNVWLGVSIETEKQQPRAAILNAIPAVVRFVSFEPLIGPTPWVREYEALDWIIIGGESGNDSGKYGYRPMDIQWMMNLMEGARSAHVPTFVKQTGTQLARVLGLKDRHGKKADEWPKWMRVREFPKNSGAWDGNI